jgi:hypothetical protein
MPFPSTLTTLALYQSSLRWFEACSCKPAPRDLPSSLAQLRGALTDRIYTVWQNPLPGDFRKEVSRLEGKFARHPDFEDSTKALKILILKNNECPLYC